MVAPGGETTLTGTAHPTRSSNCASFMRGPAVAPVSAVIEVGDSVQFAVTPTPSCDPGAPAPKFFWRSSNPSRMTVDSLGGLGIARDTGTVVISAIQVSNPAVSGASTVIIKP